MEVTSVRYAHMFYLNTAVGFLDQEFSQGSVVNVQITTSEELQLVPDSPSCDAYCILSFHNGLVDFFPTGSRLKFYSTRPNQILELGHSLVGMCILVQGNVTVPLHGEITLHLICPFHCCL